MFGSGPHSWGAIPEAVASADLNRINPQARPTGSQAPRVDTEVARTNHVADNLTRCALPDSEPACSEGAAFSFLKDFMADEDLRKGYKLGVQFDPDGQSLRIVVKDGPADDQKAVAAWFKETFRAEMTQPKPADSCPWLSLIQRHLSRAGIILEVNFESLNDWSVAFGRDPEPTEQNEHELMTPAAWDAAEIDPEVFGNSAHTTAFMNRMTQSRCAWMAAYHIDLAVGCETNTIFITVKNGPTSDRERQAFAADHLQGTKLAKLPKVDPQVSAAAIVGFDENGTGITAPLLLFLKAMADHEEIFKDFDLDLVCEPDGKTCRFTVTKGPEDVRCGQAAACDAGAFVHPALKVMAWGMSLARCFSIGDCEVLGDDIDLTIGRSQDKGETAKSQTSAPGEKTLAPVTMDIHVKDGRGINSLEGKGDLSAALKAPGRPETIYLPLGGKLSLEVKATVVPTPKP